MKSLNLITWTLMSNSMKSRKHRLRITKLAKITGEEIMILKVSLSGGFHDDTSFFLSLSVTLISF